MSSYRASTILRSVGGRAGHRPASLAEQVPSLLLQPLVENAIKLTIGRAEDGGRILIAAKLHDTELVITVEDSGSGTDEEQPQLDQLFDSYSTRVTLCERLENLYGDAFSFNAGNLA